MGWEEPLALWLRWLTSKDPSGDSVSSGYEPQDPCVGRGQALLDYCDIVIYNKKCIDLVFILFLAHSSKPLE